MQRAWVHEQNERLWLAYSRALKLKGRSEKTILNYLKSIFLLDKGILFSDAKKVDLEEFFFLQLTRVSRASVRNYYTSLKLFFAWLSREGYVSGNPVTGIEVPESDTKPPEIVGDEHLKALIRTCSKTFLGKRDEAIIRLFSEAGSPRLGEMSTLKVSSLDWRNCIVQVTGKTGTRLVPYGDRTAEALEKYLTARTRHKKSDLDALWICSRGSLGYYSFRAMLVRRCKEAGIEPLHPHSLRHKAADVAMSSGISDLDLQTLFGWSSPQMLAVYAASNRTTRAIASSRSKRIGDRL